MSGVEDLVLKLCVWYKSFSIVEENQQHILCHHLCSGIDYSCKYYVGKQEYLKAKLETCKRINAKTDKV